MTQIEAQEIRQARLDAKQSLRQVLKNTVAIQNKQRY